jgi:hypothetical protein
LDGTDKYRMLCCPLYDSSLSVVGFVVEGGERAFNAFKTGVMWEGKT